MPADSTRKSFTCVLPPSRFVLVAGRQAHVDGRGQAAGRKFASRYLVRSSISPRPLAERARASNVWVRNVHSRLKRVDERVGDCRQAADGREDRGIHVDVHERDGEAHVPTIREAVVAEHRHRIGRDIERQRRLDHVSLEERIEQRAVGLLDDAEERRHRRATRRAALLVPQVELDAARRRDCCPRSGRSSSAGS